MMATVRTAVKEAVRELNKPSTTQPEVGSDDDDFADEQEGQNTEGRPFKPVGLIDLSEFLGKSKG